jgi:hypothetical protein
MDSVTAQRLAKIKDDLDEMASQTALIKKLIQNIEMPKPFIYDNKPILEVKKECGHIPYTESANSYVNTGHTCPACKRPVHGINHRLCIIQKFRNNRDRWEEAVLSSAQPPEKN